MYNFFKLLNIFKIVVFYLSVIFIYRILFDFSFILRLFFRGFLCESFDSFVILFIWNFYIVNILICLYIFVICFCDV